MKQYGHSEHSPTLCVCLQVQLFQGLSEGEDVHHHLEGRSRTVHRGDRAVTARCHHDRTQSHQGQLTREIYKSTQAHYMELLGCSALCVTVHSTDVMYCVELLTGFQEFKNQLLKVTLFYSILSLQIVTHTLSSSWCRKIVFCLAQKISTCPQD